MLPSSVPKPAITSPQTSTVTTVKETARNESDAGVVPMRTTVAPEVLAKSK